MKRRLAVCLLVSLAAAGCWSSWAGRGGGGAPQRTATRVTVRAYEPAPIGAAAALALGCPPGARCRLVGRPPLLAMERRLRCGRHPTGSYPDPARACRALSRYVVRIRHHAMLCSCAVGTLPPADARGLYRGRRVSVGLDPCTACNQPARVLGWLHVLVPG